MWLSDTYIQDPGSVLGSQNDADEWQRYEEEAGYPVHIHGLPFYHHTQGGHIAKVVDHGVEVCCDSSRHHLGRLVVHVSYEVEALNCFHDVKGAVVMHEKMDREAEEY